jgi:hypothetical protein
VGRGHAEIAADARAAEESTACKGSRPARKARQGYHRVSTIALRAYRHANCFSRVAMCVPCVVAVGLPGAGPDIPF